MPVWLDLVLRVVSLLLVYTAGAVTARARAARHLSRGWHYLAIVQRERREISHVDLLVAFSEDEHALAARQHVLDEADVSADT